MLDQPPSRQTGTQIGYSNHLCLIAWHGPSWHANFISSVTRSAPWDSRRCADWVG